VLLPLPGALGRELPEGREGEREGKNNVCCVPVPYNITSLCGILFFHHDIKSESSRLWSGKVLASEKKYSWTVISCKERSYSWREKMGKVNVLDRKSPFSAWNPGSGSIPFPKEGMGVPFGYAAFTITLR
jgi:hypothetical protein